MLALKSEMNLMAATDQKRNEELNEAKRETQAKLEMVEQLKKQVEDYKNKVAIMEKANKEEIAAYEATYEQKLKKQQDEKDEENRRLRESVEKATA